MPDARTQKILIVKIGAIGDVVMALPLISSINETAPDAHITWICGETVYPLLQNVPGINKIIRINENSLFKANIIRKLFELLKLYLKISFRYYDHIFILYRDKRYKLLTFFTFKQKLSSFTGRDRNSKFIPGRYYGREFVRLWTGVDDFSIKDVKYPHIDPPLNETLLKSLPSGTGKKIIIQPGGAKNILQDNDLRRWSIQNYVTLTEKLISHGYSVILTGSESDKWVISSFAGLNITNLIEKTSLTDLLAVLGKVNLLVSHDTGVLHLTKLTGTPAVGLFGPVYPGERIPWNSNIYPIWGGRELNCSPCYDGKYFAACKNNICMQKISVDEVFELITKLCF